MTDKKRIIAHASCLALLAAAILIAFADVLPAERGLFFRDHLAVYKPRWWYVRESLRAFQLPTLGQASPLGVPLEHVLNATFTPPALLLAAAPDFDTAYDLFVLSHVAILAAGVYVLALSFGARPHEALLSAAIASLSGPMLSLDSALAVLQGLAWAPWTYAALRRLYRSPRLENAALLALPLGFHLQGLTWILIAIDAAAFLAISRTRGATQRSPRITLALGGLLGLAIGAIGLIPAIEAAVAAAATGAGADLPVTDSASRLAGIPSIRLLELFVPSAFAPPEAPFIEVGLVTGGAHAGAMKSLYLGSAAAFFTLAGRGARGWLVLAAAIATLLALYGGFSFLFTAAPFAGPSEPAMLLVPAAAAFAAFAPLALRRAATSPDRLVLGAFLSICGALILMQVGMSDELGNVMNLAFADFRPAARILDMAPESLALQPKIPLGGNGVPATVQDAFLPRASPSADLAQTFQDGLVPRLLHALAFGGLFLIVSALFRGDQRRRAILSPAVAAIVLFDLALAGRFTIAGADVGEMRPSEDVVAAISGSKQRVFALRPRGYEAPAGIRDGETFFESMVRSDALRGLHLFDADLRRFPYLDLESADVTGMSWAVRMANLLAKTKDDRATRLMQRAGIEWVTTWFSSLHGSSRLAMSLDVPGEAAERIFRLEHPVPYARVYGKWIGARADRLSDSAARRFFLAPENEDVALILDGGRVPTSTAAPCAQSDLHVELKPETRPGEIHASVDARCPAILVVQEHARPGWTAWVDTRPVEVLTAELGWIAAPVPPGAHHVRFAYLSFAAKWLPLWAVGLLTSIMLLGFSLRRT